MSASPNSPGELLADRAYVALRDRIVSLQIPPGSPIDEDGFGAELQMGRTPVREAIKRLALENLVTVFPRRGTFASEINITDLADVCDVRVQLEGHAALRAAERLTPDQREELDRLLRELACGEAGADAEGDADADGASEAEADTPSLMALDARIHRFIYRAAGNPYMEETLGRYFNLSLRIWYLAIDRLPHLGASVHEHAGLLRAIADGDGETAKAIIAEHIETFEREIRAVL